MWKITKRLGDAMSSAEEVPRDIIYNDPKIYAYIKDFGLHPDNNCLVEEAEGRVIGADETEWSMGYRF